MVTRTRIVLSFAVTTLLGLAVLAHGQNSRKQTLTGVVSDTMCGAKHMASGKTAAECTRICVQSNVDYSFVVGDKVYTLKGNKAEIDKHAGERATVTGTLSGSIVQVDTIKATGKGS